MCIACRSGKPKNELIRIVRAKDTGLAVDETGKAQGRGFYLCANAACVDKAKKIFPKVMRHAMDETLYEELKGIVEKFGK